MQVFGIGALELVFILIIALLVLGPRGMISTAKQAGEIIRKLVRSPLWHDVVDTSREIRELPGKLAREAGVEKELDLLRRAAAGEPLPPEKAETENIQNIPLPPVNLTDIPPEKTPVKKKS